jgi:3-deoxy-7-phosphoheptulonate synthase
MNAKTLDPIAVIVDCSHANVVNEKDYKAQADLCTDICQEISGGEANIKGIMLEAHFFEGNQPLVPGKTDCSTLKYGVSVTDGCLGWEATMTSLLGLQ